jgi:5-(carboxyamino)imidazole ribonucleotide synthase
MFQTEDDEILVNEVAPRPHNSGHYSIEASYTSQFETTLELF